MVHSSQFISQYHTHGIKVNNSLSKRYTGIVPYFTNLKGSVLKRMSQEFKRFVMMHNIY